MSNGPLFGVKVLVVDDDPVVLDLLGEVLTAAGAWIVKAADATEAVRALADERPDMLVCDMNLPGGGGLWVVDRAVAFDPEIGARTVVVSGEVPSDADAARLHAAGATLLPKPFRLSALTRTLSGFRVDVDQPTVDT